MFRHLRLIPLFVRVNLQNEAAYRVDFFFRMVMAVLQLGGELLMLWTIFSHTKSLAGWSVPQVIVLLGVFRVMAGVIGMVIAPNMRAIMNDVRQGTLDFVLTKPIHAQFYVSIRQIVPWRIIDVVVGLGLALIGAAQLPGGLSPLSAATFVLAIGCGAAIIYSIWLTLATATFWFTRVENIEMVFWNLFEAGRYPIDIYRPWIRWALTFVLPLAFLTTVPARMLAGRAEPAQVWPAIVVAGVLLAGASWFWRFGLRHYSGASA